MRTARFVALLLLAASTTAGAQNSPQSEAPLPTTGLDFTAIDQFWHVVDILVTDADPTEAQWHTMLDTPGYRLALMILGPVVREDVELAFKPSRHAEFDSLTKLPNDRATRLTHLVRAASLRPQLNAFRDSLMHSAPVAEAVRTAQRFLPPGATSVGEPPFVAFAIFRNDGYSLGPPGVVIDLLNAYESNLVLFLAHEFHHTYIARLQETALGTGARTDNPADRALRSAIQALRNEGIADLVDKPYPLAWPNPVRAAYVKRYNEEYAKTPATLRQLDSLLEVVADDSTKLADAGKRAQTLLWSNSHANGAYMARTIYETFGVDSLYPGETNPAAFLRTYVAAEKARGKSSPFTAKGWQVIEAFEQRYWR